MHACLFVCCRSDAAKLAFTSLKETPGFMAPEYLQYGKKGAFTDVYATGGCRGASVLQQPTQNASRGDSENEAASMTEHLALAEHGH